MDNKLKCLCLFAIMLAIIGIEYPISTTGNNTTVNNFYNNSTFFQGSTISFFLHNNTTTDTPYSSKIMNRTISPTHPKANITIVNLANGNTLIGNWTTDSINVLLIPAGIHEMHFDAVKVGAGGTHVVKLFYKCFLVNSTGENPILHGTSELSNEVLSGGVDSEIDTDFISVDINTNLTDRLKVEVYANQTGTGALPNLIVEFDDLTDSRLIIPATQQDITGLLNAKVNKSGDKMTGILNMSLNNITSMNYTFTHHIVASKTLNNTSVIPDDPTGTGSDYLGQLTSENNAASFTFSTFSNSSSHFNVFSAFRMNGTPESWNALAANTNIFFIGARGSAGAGSFYSGAATASKASLLMRTGSNRSWNSTSNPTAIELATTADGSTTRTTRQTILPNGTINIAGLAGAGNAYVCVDQYGNLYRGSPGC